MPIRSVLMIAGAGNEVPEIRTAVTRHGADRPLLPDRGIRDVPPSLR